MAISIIVPAYNTEKYLPATLESVRLQTIGDWELLIINDGSADKTGEIAEAFARLDNRIRVVHQENRGIAGARNRGFAEAGNDSEYCLFLDSDDLLEADALEVLVQVLETDPKAVAAHGLLRYIDREGNPLSINGSDTSPRRRRGILGGRLKVWPTSAPTTFGVLAYSPIALTSGLLMRRAKQEEAGIFDPGLKVAEDWHLWLRLSRLGHFAFVNRVIYSYRRHDGNITGRRELMYGSILEVRKKMYASADLNENEKRIIFLGYRYYELYRARVRFSYAARKLSRGRLREVFPEMQAAIEHIRSSLKGASSFLS